MLTTYWFAILIIEMSRLTSRRGFAAFVVLVVLLPVANQWGYGAESDNETKTLEGIESKFREVYAKEVGTPLAELLADLNDKYAAALDRGLKKATADADLNTAVALRNEIKRVGDSKSPQLVDIDGAQKSTGESGDPRPQSLRDLQATYRNQLSELLTIRDKAIAPLVAKFDVALKAHQEALTKEGKLDEAVVVKNYRASELRTRLAPDALPAPSSRTGTSTEMAFIEGREAGQPWTNNIGMTFRWIPKDTFEKGSPETELGRGREEVGIEVQLSRGFWIGQYEVTQGEFSGVMGVNPSSNANAGQRAPVENVSWQQAVAFCESLTKSEQSKGLIPRNWMYTLPSSAQWEFACRAGTLTALNSGKDLTASTSICANLSDLGWYSGNGGGSTHSVGEKPANAWGLHDMHGNVDEWCSNWFLASYWLKLVAEGTRKIKDPPGAVENEHKMKVARGGGFTSDPRFCRSATINKFVAATGSPAIGFRVILIEN